MLSPPAELVRRHDPDRFLCALFAPEALRERLFVLYAFNHELARAREVASVPMLALIRLQWWREVVEGARRSHEVAGPLLDAVEAGALDRAALLALIEARETEAEDAIPTLDGWRAHVLAGAGGLAAEAARSLGGSTDGAETARALGAAYGVAGMLRSVPALARQGRCLLPEDVLARHGLDRDGVIAAPRSPGMAGVRAELAGEGQTLLRRGRAVRLPRRVAASVLPAVLARRDLRRGGEGEPGPRSLGDRVAVMLAAARGRV
ncbi:MAG: squalene/phytoene synthase family protein [Janthinobacterium lividum]